MTTQYLIELAAKSYFWVFIVLMSVDLLYTFTDDYKKRKEIKEKLGLLPIGINFSSVISWTLFVMSCYLK